MVSKIKHLRAAVAFGDVTQFSKWRRRVGDQIADNFLGRYRFEVKRFKEETGSYVKMLGDGYMAVKPVDRHQRGSLEQFLRSSLNLIDRIEHQMARVDDPPMGFRIRGTGGRLAEIIDPPDYNGAAVDLCYGLLSVYKTTSMVVHDSMVGSLSLTRMASMGIELWHLDPVENPRIGIEDGKALWGVRRAKVI